MAVVFYRCAAAACVDDDRIKAAVFLLAIPCADILGGCAMALLGFAHVMRERPAAPLAIRDDHLCPQAAQQADGGVIDVGVQRALGAAGHHCGLRVEFALAPSLASRAGADLASGCETGVRSSRPATPAGTGPDRAG